MYSRDQRTSHCLPYVQKRGATAVKGNIIARDRVERPTERVRERAY